MIPCLAPVKPLMTFEYIKCVPLLFTIVPQVFDVGILNSTDEPFNVASHPSVEFARLLSEYVISKLTKAHKGTFTMIPIREQVTSSSVKLSVPSQFSSLTVVVVVAVVAT